MNRQIAAGRPINGSPANHPSSFHPGVAPTCALLAAMILAGCGSNAGGTSDASSRDASVSVQGGMGGDAMASSPRVSADITPTDACAMRLHEISGPLLLYFGMHDRLPARLEELRGLPGAEGDLLIACPVTGRPYGYAPQGLPIPNLKGRVVLYDPVASHSGHHWAIAILPPVEGQPLQAKVVAVAPGLLPSR